MQTTAYCDEHNLEFLIENHCRECLKRANTTERRASSELDAAPGSLPRGPWIASDQYGMHFVLSQDNEILLRADHIPFETLRAMVAAANEQMAENGADERPAPARENVKGET